MPHDSRLSGEVLGKQEETAKQPEILSNPDSSPAIDPIKVCLIKVRYQFGQTDDIQESPGGTKQIYFWYTTTAASNSNTGKSISEIKCILKSINCVQWTLSMAMH